MNQVFVKWYYLNNQNDPLFTSNEKNFEVHQYNNLLVIYESATTPG